MAQRTVVALPGRNNGPSVPQVFFPVMAAIRRGAEADPVSWQGLDQLDQVPYEEWPGWVRTQAEPHLRDLDPATTVVVGKSLGTFAAGLVADLGLPAIWVTPLLTEDRVVTELRRATAPFLLVGGTADRLWDSAVARQLSPHVVEIDGGNHGLFVPGPLERSARAIGELAAASEAFLDDVVWPD